MPNAPRRPPAEPPKPPANPSAAVDSIACAWLVALVLAVLGLERRARYSAGGRP